MPAWPSSEKEFKEGRRSPGRRKAVAVCAWGRAFLATLSLAQMRTASLGDEEEQGSRGGRSGSFGRASTFTLALITASLSFTPEHCGVKSKGVTGKHRGHDHLNAPLNV